MSETSGSHLLPPRDARLTPDAVAERGFSQVKRGYSESEVRTFLRMVADELASLANRERELANRVRSLEERLSAPAPPPSDQDLIAALGEETARVLGQARDSATELRAKAEEHARRVVREAQESARELRASTQQSVEAKSREVEEAARSRAKEIVGEARALRERVLTDLTERRAELERQVTELRSGRGRLVETYQAVERALLQATRLMADEPVLPPPSVPAPAPAPAPAPVEPAAAPTADVAPSVPTAAVVAPAPRPMEHPPPSAPPAPASPTPDAEPDAPAGGRDVGALFEQLRSEQESPPEPSEPPAASELSEPPAASEPSEPPAGSAPAGTAGGTDASAAGPSEPPTVEADASPASADAVLLRARDDALAPIAADLSRRAKRALQDEQNDVLDGLRRQRGKIDTTKILPAPDEQLARWAHVLQPAVDRAYAEGAGERDASGEAPGALLTELSRAVVDPLRGRLEDSLGAIDARSPADTELAVAQGLGARYREWRTQNLDVVLGDALAAAHARGVYDRAPAGARLRWVAAREGKCPDCDDNALEPTVRGGEFPTGQVHPPAHPGCRCLLVVESRTS